MKHKIFSIRDIKADAFITPFFLHTTEMAKRGFVDAASNPDSMFHKHPEDFALYEIGTFDDQNALVEPCLPEMVMLATAIVSAYTHPSKPAFNGKGSDEAKVSDEAPVQPGAKSGNSKISI